MLEWVMRVADRVDELVKAPRNISRSPNSEKSWSLIMKHSLPE